MNKITESIQKLFSEGVSDPAKLAFLEVMLPIINHKAYDDPKNFFFFGCWPNELNPQIRELEQAGIFEVRGPDEDGRLSVRLP